MTIEQLQEVLHKVRTDPRYERGMSYGVPRKGHLEGSVRNHCKDLDCNLIKLYVDSSIITREEMLKLAILISVHDTFKCVARKNAPITAPDSHASLARNFLAEFTDDRDLLQMVQYHDEGHSLWDKFLKHGKDYKKERLQDRIIAGINNLELFLFFTILDGYTPSKDHTKIKWFVEQVNLYVPTPRVHQALRLFGLEEPENEDSVFGSRVGVRGRG